MTEELLLAAPEFIGTRSGSELTDLAERTLAGMLAADIATVIPEEDCTKEDAAWTAADSLDIPHQRHLVSGIVCDAYVRDESRLVEDLQGTRSARPEAVESDPLIYRSVLCVPVAGWGTLVALSEEVDAFTPADMDAVERLGSFVAAARERLAASDTSETTNERLDAIATILSHDVRNPLTVANGRLELERAEGDSEHLARVATAHERVEELIEAAVAIAKTGTQVAAAQPVDLETMTQRAWASVESPGASLEVAASMELVADDGSLCRVLENLFRNAVEHGGPDPDAARAGADADRPGVTVRVGPLADASGFFVEDDGPGVPPEDRESVFERGYSADGGTGLGLFIVRNLVEAHGWDVSLHESASGGARFEFTGVTTE